MYFSVGDSVYEGSLTISNSTKYTLVHTYEYKCSFKSLALFCMKYNECSTLMCSVYVCVYIQCLVSKGTVHRL